MQVPVNGTLCVSPEKVTLSECAGSCPSYDNSPVRVKGSTDYVSTVQVLLRECILSKTSVQCMFCPETVYGVYICA